MDGYGWIEIHRYFKRFPKSITKWIAFWVINNIWVLGCFPKNVYIKIPRIKNTSEWQLLFNIPPLSSCKQGNSAENGSLASDFILYYIIRITVFFITILHNPADESRIVWLQGNTPENLKYLPMYIYIGSISFWVFPIWKSLFVR